MCKHLPIRKALSGLVWLIIVSFSNSAIAEGSTVIHYSKDGRIASAACLDFFSEKPPTTAITKAGFVTGKSNKRLMTFQKMEKTSFLPKYFTFSLVKKTNDPTFRRCSFLLTLPSRIMTERRSPEFADFLNALRSEFKSRGYKQGVIITGSGREDEVWKNKDAAYKFTISTTSGNVFMDVTKM